MTSRDYESQIQVLLDSYGPEHKQKLAALYGRLIMYDVTAQARPRHGQRLGQHVYNYVLSDVLPGNIPLPSVFYESDAKKLAVILEALKNKTLSRYLELFPGSDIETGFDAEEEIHENENQ